ncbi:unnamed protein product [Dicrocoelium dendriticum]|nr:unnamed protein product [Dicrocoelium dendriticum]
MQPSQHFASDGNLGTGGRLGRRVIVSALLGAGIGFSLGVAFHAMWQLLMRIYSGSPESARTVELRDELFSLRSEFVEMRRSLALMQKSSHDDVPEGFPSFYISDDDDDDGDEFFEIANGDSSPDNYLSAGSGDLLNSEPTSFHSLVSVSDSKRVRPRLGPALPREVADELDQLADFAMGTSTDIPSSLKVGAGGDESRLGSQAYARCLVYRAKVRHYVPSFPWYPKPIRDALLSAQWMPEFCRLFAGRFCASSPLT